MRLSTFGTGRAAKGVRRAILSGWSGLAVLLGCSLSVFGGCVEEEEGSLFTPNTTFGPPPVITAVAPTDSAQAGVDTLVITGSNFSTVAANNIIFLDSSPGFPIQTTATQISLRTPLVIGDSVAVRIATRGSDKMSNTLVYKLTAAVESFGLLGPSDLANAIIADAAGDLYVSVSVSGGGVGIKRIPADGSVNSYARDTSGVVGWTGLKFGPGGYLYAARGIRAIYRFAPGGGDPAVLWVALPAGYTINDIDFGPNQILWAAGSNTTSINSARIYSISQTPTSKFFPFAASVRSVRVFNNYLYLSAFKDSAWGIWRAPINVDSLGTPELYFNFSAAFPTEGYTPQGISFSSSGNLYIATDAPAGFVVVTPSKTVIIPYADYEELFGTSVRFLAWGSGNDIFVATGNGVLLKLKARVAGAPYY